jgi:hypothetical protein
MLVWFVNKIAKLLEKMGRVELIFDRGNSNRLYLVRYIIIKSHYISIYIHRFLLSDQADLHNHPWNFCSYVIRGGYTEVFFRGKVNSSIDPNFKPTTNKRSTTENRFAFRKANDFHRVVLDKEYSIKEIDKAPLTFFVGFRRTQVWGFLSPKGFINWKTYLGE